MRELDHKPQETTVSAGAEVGNNVKCVHRETDATKVDEQAGDEIDKKQHRNVLIAVIAFVALLIAASVAYNMLATPSNEGTSTGASSTDKTSYDEKADTGSTPNSPSTSETTDSSDSSNSSESSSSSAGSSSSSDSSSSAGSSSSITAPDFTMTDTEGFTVKLSDFKGRPILLNFWASWCGPCKNEMPDLQAAYETYRDDVQFMMVNMTGMSGETEASARALIEEGGYTFPVFFDQDNSAAKAYSVTSIPQTYLIDSEGNIIGHYVGALNSTTLEEALNQIY